MRLQVRSVGPEITAAGEPLYQRVPTKDDNGRAYSDFMLLIPGMRDLSAPELSDHVSGLQAVLGSYDQIVFADLNLNLNLLWVTLRPKLGLIPEIAERLRQRIPQAKLIAHE